MNLQDQRHARGSASAEAKWPRTTVFIIDHHELVRRGLAALVNAESDMCCCGEAPCTEEAVQAVAALRPMVVIIDVSTMRGAGLAIVQRIRKTMTGVRIIALAMTERPELVEQSLNAGAVAFVSKNGLAERVLEAVRRSQLPSSRGESGAEMGRTSASASRGGGRLDPIEREIVQLIGRGVPDRGIAIRLGLSVAMVEACRRRIRSKLNCPTATQLVELCARWTERTTPQGSGDEAVAKGASPLDLSGVNG